MKKIVILIILLLICTNAKAEDITNNCIIKLNDININNNIIDNNLKTHLKISNTDTIYMTSKEAIKGIYIEYYMYSDFTLSITSNNNTEIINDNGFLHNYIDIEELFNDTNTIEIKYDKDVDISNIYIISTGEIPSYVQMWEPTLEESDILIYSTHSDDEHIFFLGVMPTYINKGAKIQVAYFTHHNEDPIRLHEQLNGLYESGIRAYPIIGFIPDMRSEDLNLSISQMNNKGITIEEALKIQTEVIRKTKPQVILAHDINGEYGHGQHKLNTYLIKDAIIKAEDNTYDEESIKQYGTHQISKLYIHLYEENEIIMDYDTPLENFNNKTAYEVSLDSFKKHESQLKWWDLRKQIGITDNYTKASQIETYSPCKWGLYYSTIGEDINKNDFLENITYIKDRIIQNEDIQEENQEVLINKKTVNNNYNNIIMVSLLLLISISILIYKQKTSLK